MGVGGRLATEEIRSNSPVSQSQFLKIMNLMGYLSQDKFDKLTENEMSLVKRMWNVLTQSILSNNLTTLSSIKRFIFVIEGLAIDQDDDSKMQSLGSKKQLTSPKVSKNLAQLFAEYKPLYLNRLAKCGQILLSPRTCGTEDPDLTFRPILSPKNEQILEQSKLNSVHADPELRKRRKYTDECTFQPNLVARQPRPKKQNFLISGSR